MIYEKIGNIFDSEAGVIVHGCNSIGKMKSGIAKEVHERFEHVFNVYANSMREMGSITYAYIGDNRILVNGITQKFYGRNPNVVYVDYDALRLVFRNIVQNSELSALAKTHGLHFPLIGCGLANGNWQIVQDIILEEVPEEIKKTLWIFERD